MKQFSDFLRLNWFDLTKGLIVAVLSAVLSVLYEIIGDGTMPTGAEWKQIGGIAAASAIAYLIKNFFSNSGGQPLASEKGQ